MLFTSNSEERIRIRQRLDIYKINEQRNKNLNTMSHYTGKKSACEAYNKKVSDTLGFGGSITSSWADVRRHPAKSLFSIIAHPTIEAENLTFKEQLTPDWTPDETDQP